MKALKLTLGSIFIVGILILVSCCEPVTEEVIEPLCPCSEDEQVDLSNTKLIDIANNLEISKEELVSYYQMSIIADHGISILISIIFIIFVGIGVYHMIEDKFIAYMVVFLPTSKGQADSQVTLNHSERYYWFIEFIDRCEKEDLLLLALFTVAVPVILVIAAIARLFGILSHIEAIISSNVLAIEELLTIIQNQ